MYMFAPSDVMDFPIGATPLICLSCSPEVGNHTFEQSLIIR